MTFPNPMQTADKVAYRASRRERVAEMYLKQRMTQEQIAFVLKVDQSTISRDIKHLQAEWDRAAVDMVAEIKARDVAELEVLENEAASQYALTQNDTKTKLRWFEARLRVKGQKAVLLGLNSPNQTLIGGMPDRPLKVDDINAIRDERWSSIEEKLAVLISNGNGHDPTTKTKTKRNGVRANGKVSSNHR